MGVAGGRRSYLSYLPRFFYLGAFCSSWGGRRGILICAFSSVSVR